mgnify:CR=1 FL=1
MNKDLKRYERVQKLLKKAAEIAVHINLDHHSEAVLVNTNRALMAAQNRIIELKVED